MDLLCMYLFINDVTVVRRLIDNHPGTDITEGMSPSALLMACQHGSAEMVELLFDRYPDITCGISGHCRSYTPLHQAALSDRPDIVKILLKRGKTNFDVNAITNGKLTAFTIACYYHRNSECAKLLLDDPRTDPETCDVFARTPLCLVIKHMDTGLLRHWLATGRKLGLTETLGIREAINTATVNKWAEGVELLERHSVHPVLLRHEMRLELGWLETEAARFFAAVVFLSDGLLRLKVRNFAITMDATRSRFLRIAERLPLELQMVLCHRLVGSSKSTVLGVHSEPAFRELASEL
jgi:hypothetical protein